MSNASRFANQDVMGQEPVLVGASPAIARMQEDIAAAARTDATVLVTGETGSGKEVVARLVHARSIRAGRPFVAVNCCGIPESLLESELFGHVRGSFTGAVRDSAGLVRRAEHGTLFLDELGDMSLRMQAVLLRFTENGEIQPVGSESPAHCRNVRLIAATHRDLAALVRDGSFRQDLYYRVNVLLIRVPPLRERASDIPLLLQHFLERAGATYRRDVPMLSPAVRQFLEAHPWPGNIRQLRSVAERLAVAVSGRDVTFDDLPEEMRRDFHAASPRRTLARPVGERAVASDRSVRAATLTSASTDPVDLVWDRLQSGESFWSVVYQPFQLHDLRREDVRALLRRGLAQTGGNYRALLETLRVPASDQRRFMAFLTKHDCCVPTLPVPASIERRLTAAS